MKKITLSENCFGRDVEINDESLFTHEFDNRSPEMISDLKDSVIDKLKSLKHKLGIDDWTDIVNIIIKESDEFEYDTENSMDSQPCDTCGNWNHEHIYNKRT
jgi:hypothetical protein